MVVVNSAAGSNDKSAAASGQRDSGSEGIPKEGLISRLLRPLKDFGFGRKSFWEGGVGAFVFAGIGKGFCPSSGVLQALHSLVYQSLLCTF